MQTAAEIFRTAEANARATLPTGDQASTVGNAAFTVLEGHVDDTVQGDRRLGRRRARGSQNRQDNQGLFHTDFF
jgi:hypothetical protein